MHNFRYTANTDILAILVVLLPPVSSEHTILEIDIHTQTDTHTHTRKQTHIHTRTQTFIFIIDIIYMYIVIDIIEIS